MRDKIGAIYEDMALNKKSALFLPIWFVLRRSILAITFVSFRHFSLLQLLILLPFLSLTSMIYIL